MLIDDSFEVKSNFLDTIATDCHPEIGTGNFGDDSPIITDMLNEWVSTQTRGMIKKVFDSPIDPRTKLAILNMIYFKGKWNAKFDAMNNNKAAFYSHGQNAKHIDTMYQSNSQLRYCHQEDYSILELDYIGNASIVIILPNEKSGLEKVLVI